MVTMRVLALVALCACGRLGFEARTDVDADLPQRGEVTIVASTHFPTPTSGPLAGAVAWSTTADGVLDGVVVTGADGRAQLVVDRGGTVSLYDPGAPWLATIVEVEPGDTLQFGATFPACEDSSLGKVTLDWQAVANATSYETLAGCMPVAAATPPLDVVVDPAVREPFDVVLRAYDANGVLLASATKPAAAFHDGVAHAFAAPEWRPGVVTDLGFTELPAVKTQLLAMLSTATASVPNADWRTGEGIPDASALVIQSAVPADATRMTLVAITEALFDSPETQLYVRVDAPLGVVAASPAPPTPIAAAWDGGRRELSWLLPDSDLTDSFDALLGFSDAVGELQLIWSVRAPPTARSVRFPPLPAEVVIADVAAATIPEHYLLANNYADATTYREARQRGEGIESLFAAVGLPTVVKDSGAFAIRASIPEPTARARVVAPVWR